MTYFINYHTGAGNTTDDFDSLFDAMLDADDGVSYTQGNITIEDAKGGIIAQRSWFGYKYDPDEDECENPIKFGSFGFYADWVIA